MAVAQRPLGSAASPRCSRLYYLIRGQMLMQLLLLLLLPDV